MGLTIDRYSNIIAATSADNGMSASRTYYDTIGASAGGDTVRVSAKGHFLSSALGSIILPTEENVTRLAGALSTELGQFLSGAGISSEPPVEMSVDWSNGCIQVKGESAASRRIEQLINGNQGIAGDIRNLAAIASQTAAIADSLKFQKEYLASRHAESVVAKYAYLFGSNRSSADISLALDSDGIQVMTNGKPWVSSAD